MGLGRWDWARGGRGLLMGMMMGVRARRKGGTRGSRVQALGVGLLNRCRVN